MACERRMRSYDVSVHTLHVEFSFDVEREGVYTELLPGGIDRNKYDMLSLCAVGGIPVVQSR